MFRPSVEAAGVRSSWGSVDTTKITSVTYNAVLCQTCRNTISDNLSKIPLKIVMSDYDKIVVVPCMLATQLLALYSAHEIILIVRQYRVCFEKIYKSWVRTGSNICKKSRVGKKVRIKTRYVTLDCWVIVDCSDVCYIRLAYGGGKIQCP